MGIDDPVRAFSLEAMRFYLDAGMRLSGTNLAQGGTREKSRMSITTGDPRRLHIHFHSQIFGTRSMRILACELSILL
jgi:hypothetical protein